MRKISTMLLGTWDVYQDGDTYYLYVGSEPILRYQKGVMVRLIKSRNPTIEVAQVKYLTDIVEDYETKVTVREVLNILSKIEDPDQPLENTYNTLESLLKVCKTYRDVNTPTLGET